MNNEKKVLEELKDTLLKRWKKEILLIELFGSYARGTFSQESDLDVLVVFKNNPRFFLRELIGLAVDIGLKYDKYISLKPISQERFEYLSRTGSIFLKNILKDAKLIWKKP